MVLVEDDNLVNPSIPEPQFQFILHLPDTPLTYRRYFDGLLIPRPEHPSFFRDLRAFRTQASVIVLFTSCDSNPDIPKETTRARYRNITSTYLASRFAHPWCRKAMAGTASNKGWWGAEWAATGRKMSKEAKEQEEKLHKLLVPIWVVMRARMFPGDEEVETWYAAKMAKEEEEKRVRERMKVEAGDRLGKTGTEIESKEINKGGDMSQPKPDSKHIRPFKSHTNIRQGYHDSEDEMDMEDELRLQGEQAAHAATSVFRLAAAGLIVESMPKREKWRLRRLLKKS